MQKSKGRSPVGVCSTCDIATLRDNAPCVAESAPNKRRGLYRIAHLAFVTVYLVGQLAPLVASSVSCVSRSLDVTKHPLIPQNKA